MAYFECIIGSGSATAIPLIVTCSSNFAGTTITASKTGARTQTQTCPSSSPYEVTFILPEDGTWTISGIVSGQTFSETVTILPYEANLNDIPDGATVTPTDDIQIWLHCANIWDKAYTTISQVLADTSTLQALIASTNAVDYMARSTTWSTNVTANSSAMGYIGLNDYCSDALLADLTWLTAICNSTYFESVLNVKVPTMTSNTTPSGVASSNGNNVGQPFNAFDNNSTTRWGGTSPSNRYVQYMFTDPVEIFKISILSHYEQNNSTIKNFKVQASNDNSNFVDVFQETLPTGHTQQTYNIGGSNKYKYWRLFGINSYTNSFISINVLQFYGRA